MTSYEISKHLQSLLDATAAERALTKYLFVLAKGYERISGELVEALQAKSRSFFSMKQQDSQERFNELRKQAENFPLGQIFHDAIELQSLLKTLATSFQAGDSHFLREMSRHLAGFHEVFEKLVRNPTRENFAGVLPEAAYLYTIVVTSRQFFSGMRQALQLQGDVRPGRLRLTLAFDTTSGFDAVVKKLGALQTGYREICRLAGISVDEQPMEIVKLEATTLWVCVDGERAAISVLTSLIEGFAIFWYRRFSSEDRLAACSDRVSATQTLIILADELERAGIIQVSPSAAEVKDGALVLRQVMLDLLEGEPMLRVNEKSYAVDAALRKQYLDVSSQAAREAAQAPPAAARLAAPREVLGPVLAAAPAPLRTAAGYEA